MKGGDGKTKAMKAERRGKRGALPSRSRGARRAVPYVVAAVIVLVIAAIALRHFATRGPRPASPAGRTAAARSLVLVTIDTLRADHVGAYGYAKATTPTLDAMARDGVRFDHAYATAPITLPSHASMLTGRYPPGHGARDNLMPVSPDVPTLASVLRAAGFQTAAFIAAFPLDRRFGLSRGFDVYGDRMPRGPDGKPLNERPGREVVDDALTWLAGHREQRFFLWVHLFEPHAPYGDPVHDSRSPVDRYDDEIREADAQVGRLLNGLGNAAADTVVVVAGDHGEAFGEHGEIGHSIFVYDTTLRVPWLMRGPGVRAGGVVTDRVCLIDLAPTVLDLLGERKIDADGIDLRGALDGAQLPARDLYAESFAPLTEFGWSPLRALRSGKWKAIAAPRPELYDLGSDPGETRDVASTQAPVQQALSARIDRYAPADLRQSSAGASVTDREAAARLSALGYVQGASATGGPRADPKDRRDLAARIETVAAGELQGEALEKVLLSILKDDPGNPQAHLRLADYLLKSGNPGGAEPHFEAVTASRLPSVDAYIGLAACQAALGRPQAAQQTLAKARALEPQNPVLAANLGILHSRAGRYDAAIAALRDALALDPGFDEARFNLALAYAHAGRRGDAEREATELLARLPSNAPQRSEVERLLKALRQ